MTTLNEALTILATDLSLDAEGLIAYTQEDRIGGFNLDVNQRKWGTGSIWEVEGQVLFALVRALKPARVIEVGTWFGCGASHILEALTLNKKGGLISIDIDGNAGRDIPYSLRKRWQFVNAAAQDLLADSLYEGTELVFEDGPHDVEETASILAQVRDVVKPSLCISHDGMHFNVGVNVQAAYRQVFGQAPRTLLIEPSDCGFAYQVLK